MTSAALGDADLPALYRAADRSSLSGQRRLMRSVMASVGLTVLAAICSLSDADWAAYLAGACFLAAVLAGVYVLVDRPEKAWYDGRATAESAKSLAWQYAVGGGEFSKGTKYDPEALLIDSLEKILSELRGFALIGSANDGTQITDRMRSLRSLTIAERRDAYLSGRIDHQRSWYSRKASWNAQRTTVWRVATLTLQGGGALAAFLRATGAVEIDLMGVLAAAAAGCVAWLQARDHSNLAEAYAVTAQELALVHERIAQSRGLDERTWAALVEEAEAAVSREHTLWLARRGTVALVSG